MQTSYNLLDEAWLPCVQQDGQLARLNLRDTFAQAHTLREIQGETPLATVALHRLLLTILHRNFGPKNRTAWLKLWRQKQWDMPTLDTYFEHWHDRFDLFHDTYPFYQTPTPPRDPEPVNSRLSLPHAYNSTLFEHQLKDGSLTISPARAAEWLITLQASGIGAGPPKHPYAGGPLVNCLLVLVQGQTLFETLIFNLIQYDPSKNKPIPAPARGPDLPIWEYDENPYPSEPKIFYRPGYLGYLTWQVRRVHLFPAWENEALCVRECAIAQGPRWEPSIEDPLKVYVMSKSKDVGMLPIRLRENRALWRDTGALFRFQDREPKVRPPTAFYELAYYLREKDLDRARTCNYMTLGLSNNNARLNFFRHERMPLPLDYLADEVLGEKLHEALQAAESVGFALRGAGRDFARWIVSPADKSKAHRDDVKLIFAQLNIEQRYWSRLEAAFHRFIVDLPHAQQTALDTWIAILQNTARRAYEQATARLDDPLRGLKAATLARGFLEYQMAKVLLKE